MTRLCIGLLFTNKIIPKTVAIFSLHMQMKFKKIQNHYHKKYVCSTSDSLYSDFFGGRKMYIQNWAAHIWSDSDRAAESFSNFKLWQFVAFQPFDLQRHIVPLWKDLKPIATTVLLKRLAAFKDRFCSLISSIIYVHRAYLW